LELLGLSEEDMKVIGEMIQNYREQKMKREEAEAWEREQKENAEILDKLRKEERI